MTHWNTSIIPLTFEKYLSLIARFFLNGVGDNIYCSLVFIDSYQFMSSSLSKLVAICSSMPYSDSLQASKTVTCGKGVFPYGYFSSPLVLHETQLPAKELFFMFSLNPISPMRTMSERNNHGQSSNATLWKTICWPTCV